MNVHETCHTGICVFLALYSLPGTLRLKENSNVYLLKVNLYWIPVLFLILVLGLMEDVS